MLPATPAQDTLIRYWQQLPRAEGQGCPARRAVNPFHLGHALSDITLVETGGAQGPVIRLAGSSITALAGRPLGGLAVDSLDGPLAGLWRLGVDEALASGGPVHGRIAAATLPGCACRCSMATGSCASSCAMIAGFAHNVRQRSRSRLSPGEILQLPRRLKDLLTF